MITPWGKADHKEVLAPGIVFYSTPSHGGLKVNKEQNQKIPLILRKQNGWYEEDCEYYKVVYAYPELFTKITHEQLLKALYYWYPNEMKLLNEQGPSMMCEYRSSCLNEGKNNG